MKILAIIITNLHIAWNKQIETREIYNMNQNSIIDFTKRYSKIKLRYNVENMILFLHAKMNPDKLPPLIINDACLHEEEEI